MGHIEVVLVIEQGHALGTSPAWVVKKFWTLLAAMSPREGLRAARVPGDGDGPIAASSVGAGGDSRSLRC